MKKILVLNYEFPPLGGGAGNATHYLLKEFAKYPDLKIDLVTSSVNKFKIEQFSDNICIHYLDINKKGNFHYQSIKDLLVYSIKAYFYCKKLKQEEKIDLVHAFFGIPCGYIAMKLKIPYIVSLRGSDVPFYNKRFYWLDKLFFKRLSKEIWKRSKAIIANSQGLKDLALKITPHQEISVIYNGVDTAQFFPVTKDNGEFVIISTSRLIKRKGIKYLIEAFVDFERKYKNSRLLIVGDGDLKEEFVNKIKVAGLDKKVEFFGSVEHKNLPKIYQRADVFVLPSLNEGMSNSVLEAMASGLAIITTDVGGSKELINEENGIIVDKNSEEEIYNALEKFYNSRGLLEKMKIVSRQKAEKMSWNFVVKKYSQIYE